TGWLGHAACARAAVASVGSERTPAARLWKRLRRSMGSPFVGIDEVLRTGRSFAVDRDVLGVERFGERHRLGVVAGEGGLERVDHALAQPRLFRAADLL